MEILRKTSLFKLEQQTKDIPVEDVTELAFSSLPLPPAVQLAPFRFLQRFTLVALRPTLTALLDIPLAQFPLLRVLDVSDNKIASVHAASTATANSITTTTTTSAGAVAAVAPSLVRLFLSNNSIASMQFLEQLAVLCPALEVLDVSENPIANELVRCDVFQLWKPRTTQDNNNNGGAEVVTGKGLVALDGKDEAGNEVEILDSDEDSDEEEEEEDEEEEDEEEDEEEESDTDEPPKKVPRTE